MNRNNETLSTEERILKSAKKIFIANGFDGTRTQDIALDAGVNKALLHYYYKNKETLFEAVFDYVSRDFVPKMLEIAYSEQPFKEKIEAIIDNYIRFYSQNTPELLFIINEMNKNPARFTSLFMQTNNFSKLAEFAAYLQKEMLIGNIKMMHPVHFFVNIVSLCAFPSLSAPMIKMIGQINDEQFAQFIEQRRQIVKQLIFDSILIGT
ncbi:MAG: hypothetical protein RI894_1255 [Bacteroidota bacterium]|jgi:AcrR family transcriptional regulator